MWTGITPTEMVTFQEQYYLQVGGKRNGKKCAVIFVDKMIRATIGIWLERNDIFHLRTSNGTRGICMMFIQTAVEQQLEVCHESLDEEDHYLLDTDAVTIMKDM